MPEARRSILQSRRLVRAATVVIAVLVVASTVAIWLLRLGTITDTQRENHRLGVVFAEQTTRALQSVDMVLLDVAEKMATSGARDAVSLQAMFSGQDIHENLARRLVNLPQADAFAMVDAAGHFVNGSRQWPMPAADLTQRAYFRDLSGTADPGPYITEPTYNAVSHDQSVFLARRVSTSDGRFLGIVMSSIRLGYFAGVFADAGFSEGETISILRRDGEVLVRYPEQGVTPGDRIPSQSPWYQTVAAGGGYYHSPGAFASVGPSYVSVHPLKLYPAVIDVTRVEADALYRWRRQAAAIGTAALIATIILIAVLRALSRQIALIERSQNLVQRQVSATLASEARLAAKSAMLQTTLDHMDQGLIMVDATGHVCVCNRRAFEILDLPAELLSPQPLMTELIALRESRGEYSLPQDPPFDPAILLSRHATYERRRPDGTVIEVRSAPLEDGGMVRTFTDITARSVAEEMLGLAASHDQLTGLANRNGFYRGLATALAAAQRTGSVLALLCLDLDRFKAVNDSLGHSAGDQLLTLVAERMGEIARATDLIGRLGGDEFAIMLPGANLEGAEHMCGRLLEAIKLPFTLGGQVVRIGVSIGIANFPADGATSEQLLCNADQALYRAKAGGRNMWCAYVSGDGERELERLQLEQAFRQALEQRAFTLAYQPICDSVTREPVAFEALCRWTHPTNGPISPTEFIPIAEATGLIIPLGRWVIATACAEAATWALPLSVAVNLSPAQFLDAGLLGCIEQCLRDSGLAAARLHLEVTEGLLLEQSDETLNTMHALRELGIRMVLDDFGVAHANLNYLRGLPFDTVKIDRSFLRALNSDRQARALVEAMLAMARALGLEVIGEGVETAEQLALLCHLQCRWVQGYYLGRPAPPGEIRYWIARLAAEDSTRLQPQLG